MHAIHFNGYSEKPLYSLRADLQGLAAWAEHIAGMAAGHGAHRGHGALPCGFLSHIHEKRDPAAPVTDS